MCKSDTNDGRVRQQDFVAIANGCFSIPKSQHKWLNWNNTIDDNDKDDYIFEVIISNETTLYTLLKNELCLFRHLHVKLKDFKLPLIWWKSHESQFSNIFVVQQILGIHSWVLNWNWKDFQHNWNIDKPLVWIYNLAWWTY